MPPFHLFNQLVLSHEQNVGWETRINLVYTSLLLGKILKVHTFIVEHLLTFSDTRYFVY